MELSVDRLGLRNPPDALTPTLARIFARIYSVQSAAELIADSACSTGAAWLFLRPLLLRSFPMKLKRHILHHNRV